MATLATVKLRNRLRAIRPDLVVEIKNVRVNGQLRGCSGFVRDPARDRIVYVDTEAGFQRRDEALYRTASSMRDYTGGRNLFTSFDELPHAIVDLLERAA